MKPNHVECDNPINKNYPFVKLPFFDAMKSLQMDPFYQNYI